MKKPLIPRGKTFKLWLLRVSVFDCIALLCMYAALSPILGMGLYNHLIFFPMKPEVDLTKVFEGLEKMTTAKKIDVTIPSGKNEKLAGWYLKKEGASKLIIVSHGNGGSIDHRIVLLPSMLRCKTSVLMYDYRGYGKSTGEPTIDGIKEDGLSVYDYAKNELHYKPENIIVYGESLGSGVTTYIARNRTVGGIIIQSGFSSLSDAAKDRLPWLWLYPQLAFAGVELDNAGYLNGKHAPLLLVHGDKDAILPIKHAYKVIANASEPKTFVKVAGAGHNDVSTFDVKVFATALQNFVDAPALR